MGLKNNLKGRTRVQTERTTKGLILSWNVLAVAITFVSAIILEIRFPLRRIAEGKVRRTGRNLAVAALSAAALQLSERPLTRRLTQFVERHRFGLLPRCGLPPAAETVAALLLLDYTLYLWHGLAHRVPFLWRFHQAHHSDLDMDASTALRFHAGELVLSAFCRSLQILGIGVKAGTITLWNSLLLVEVIFHHSNIRLPPKLEQYLSILVVTPRMHGIHHSIVPEEAGSNRSSGLTLWDWLHGTLKLDIPQDEITIGLAPYRYTEQVTLGKTLRMPLDPLRSPALLPDGSAATRATSE